MLLIGRKKNGWRNQWCEQFNRFGNINLNKKAIHIHGGMEHNLAGDAKYYSCGNTKILGSNAFTR
jgi:hypothetical protein